MPQKNLNKRRRNSATHPDGPFPAKRPNNIVPTRHVHSPKPRPTRRFKTPPLPLPHASPVAIQALQTRSTGVSPAAAEPPRAAARSLPARSRLFISSTIQKLTGPFSALGLVRIFQFGASSAPITPAPPIAVKDLVPVQPAFSPQASIVLGTNPNYPISQASQQSNGPTKVFCVPSNSSSGTSDSSSDGSGASGSSSDEGYTPDQLRTWDLNLIPNHHPSVLHGEVGIRHHSLTRDAWYIDPQNGAMMLDADDIVALDINQDQQQAWLASSAKWQEGSIKVPGEAGGSWVGKKMLGVGSYGLVGLWEYEISDKTAVNTMPVTKVVVKQSSGKNLAALTREMGFLQALNDTGSDHVVKLYGGSKDADLNHGQKDFGRGTIPKHDPHLQEVRRMFLEYCPGGDMDNLLRRYHNKFNASDNLLPEVMIWHIFKCLAMALVVLEWGTEDSSVQNPSWHPIVHFDIKPPNFLCGAEGGAPDHVHTPVLKIADFGLAMPLETNQDDYYWKRYRLRGTPQSYPPEQIKAYDMAQNHYGPPMNTFGIGLCMYQIINRGREFRVEDFDDRFFIDTEDGPAVTQGQDLLNAPYSAALRRLVLRCLITNNGVSWGPVPGVHGVGRIRSRTVLEEVLKGIEVAETTMFQDALRQVAAPVGIATNF